MSGEAVAFAVAVRSAVAEVELWAVGEAMEMVAEWVLEPRCEGELERQALVVKEGVPLRQRVEVGEPV